MDGRSHADILDWIDTQQPVMCRNVERWAVINSGSRNAEGVNRVGEAVLAAAAPLQAQTRTVDLKGYESIDDAGRPSSLSVGRAVLMHKRPEAPLQALLAIHLDTVYPIDDAFQMVKQLDANTITGPGVADAKGGVAVLLTALMALERSPQRDRLGWRVVLNPDEEIGSPASTELFASEAQGAHVALVFEPALPDGSLISERKGSGNFTLVVRGRAAHAGRDFAHGRNAVHAMALAVVQLSAINQTMPGVTVNVGRVSGGGPVNRVPDLAVARFNIRVQTAKQQQDVAVQLAGILKLTNEHEGIAATLHGSFAAPPKPMDERTQALLHQINDCGRTLGVPIQWQSSGGVCDGNRLAAAGLPTIDTLGPRGGNLHSPGEYLLIDSLAERAKLTALLLLRYAAGDLAPPPRG